MKNISIIGSDSTHTEEYVLRINKFFSKNFKVTKIYGDSFEETKIKAKKLGIKHVSKSIKEAIKDVDFVMILGRYGDSHYVPTVKTINSGIPVFVDKPFTTNLNEAKKLIDLSKKKKVPMISSSPLRFSNEVIKLKKYISKNYNDLLTLKVTVPSNCIDLGDDPRLNSVFFYGIHGIEVLLEIADNKIKNFDVKYFNSSILCEIKFLNNKIFLFELINNSNEFYWIDVFSKNHNMRYNINLDGSYYLNTLNFIFEKFMTNKELIKHESTFDAISILNHIESNKL